MSLAPWKRIRINRTVTRPKEQVERKLDKSNYLHSRCKLDPSMFLLSNYAFTLAINIIIFLVLYKLHSVNGPLYLFALWPSPLPYCAGSAIKAHLTSYEQRNPELVKVLRQIFVDDLSTGAYSVEHAFDIYQKSKETMSAGSFNLRKWNSNSKELLCKIEREERQFGGLESRQSEATLPED